MVEYTIRLDSTFASLADPTRRDILRRVAEKAMSISDIARPYNLTFAAVSKHLMVLEKAHLIKKQRQGKEQIVSLAPQTLKSADDYLEFYRKLWECRLDSLEEYLSKEKESS